MFFFSFVFAGRQEKRRRWQQQQMVATIKSNRKWRACKRKLTSWMKITPYRTFIEILLKIIHFFSVCIVILVLAHWKLKAICIQLKSHITNDWLTEKKNPSIFNFFLSFSSIFAIYIYIYINIYAPYHINREVETSGGKKSVRFNP